MFGTLNTKTLGKEPAFIANNIGRRAGDGSIRMQQYTACDACRAKKVGSHFPIVTSVEKGRPLGDRLADWCLVFNLVEVFQRAYRMFPVRHCRHRMRILWSTCRTWTQTQDTVFRAIGRTTGESAPLERHAFGLTNVQRVC